MQGGTKYAGVNVDKLNTELELSTVHQASFPCNLPILLKYKSCLLLLILLRPSQACLPLDSQGVLSHDALHCMRLANFLCCRSGMMHFLWLPLLR